MACVVFHPRRVKNEILVREQVRFQPKRDG
jgi:hypothetical protein